MKLLVVSHNVFCENSNMGKTLNSYFRGWKADELAQFYIHSEIPTSYVCENYYRITDKEMIVSMITRKSGEIFSKEDIDDQVTDSRTAKGITATLYQKARSKTPIIYILRNLWWTLGRWNTEHFNQWIDDFEPDCVFLASGDYAFMYKIALNIAETRNIPLFVSCMDDYYFSNRNEKRFLGKWVHKCFMKQVRRTMQYASALLTICDKMAEDYQQLFHKPCYTIHTSAAFEGPLSYKKKNQISYIGNLDLMRDQQILEIAKVLKKIDLPNRPQYIDVYSPEARPEILDKLTEANGIRFHGKISAEKVLQVMGESLAVVHTESFDPIIRKQVKYSVSTKIADSLASGTPILAYGPEEVASIQYLMEHGAAFCATNSSELEKAITELLGNPDRYQEVLRNAHLLSQKNHAPKKNCSVIRNILSSVLV